MSTSSSEEGSWMAGHHATSSALESTGSLLFSLPSDSSDVQTEITPPTSPTPSEGKTRTSTPRDIPDACRRLGRISASALQEGSGIAPTKPLRQFHHRAPFESLANDEAGYDADGDGDGDRDRDKGSRAGAGTTATMRPIRRPTFLRIDTRQRRRVASLLATRRPTSSSPEPGFGNVDIQRPPRAKLAALPSIRLKPTAAPAANAASYELRRRPRAEPVGLGIGFPENHPLRSRAFSMPVPTSTSPISEPDELREEDKMQVEGQAQGRAWRPEWLPSSLSIRSKKEATRVDMYAPSPVRLALRPTFLELSPSPIERLPAQAGAGVFLCDNVRDRALAHEGRTELGIS